MLTRLVRLNKDRNLRGIKGEKKPFPARLKQTCPPRPAHTEAQIMEIPATLMTSWCNMMWMSPGLRREQEQVS